MDKDALGNTCPNGSEKIVAQGDRGATPDDDHIGIERVGEPAEHAAEPCSRRRRDVERTCMGPLAW